MDAFLKIRGLKKHFGKNHVLDGIDLDVAEASVTTIIGKSGIGKSVLLKCIANLLPSDGGTIELDGKAISRSRRAANSEAGVSFSYMFQNNALFDSLSAFENIALPLREATKLKKAEIKDRVDEMLGHLALGDSAERFPGELSGGMKMRVSIARAMVTHPKLILMDEPFAALDEITRQKLNDDLLSMKATIGATVIFVTHSVFESVFLSDRILVMAARPGRVVKEFRIDAPYPRGIEWRTAPEYGEIARAVSDTLHGTLNPGSASKEAAE